LNATTSTLERERHVIQPSPTGLAGDHISRRTCSLCPAWSSVSSCFESGCYWSGTRLAGQCFLSSECMVELSQSHKPPTPPHPPRPHPKPGLAALPEVCSPVLPGTARTVRHSTWKPYTASHAYSRNAHPDITSFLPSLPKAQTETLQMPRPKREGAPSPKRRSRNGCWCVRDSSPISLTVQYRYLTELTML